MMVTWNKAACPLGYGLMPLSLLGSWGDWKRAALVSVLQTTLSQPLLHLTDKTDLHLSQDTLPSPHFFNVYQTQDK